MDEKRKEILQKVYALYEGTTSEGEKDNAHNILLNAAASENITFDELISLLTNKPIKKKPETLQRRRFDIHDGISGKEISLLRRIFKKFLIEKREYTIEYDYEKNHHTLTVQLTNSEYSKVNKLFKECVDLHFELSTMIYDRIVATKGL